MRGSASIRLRAIALFGFALLASGQTNSEASNTSLDSLLHEVQELRVALEDVRGQLAGTLRESQDLRRELESMRQQLAGVRTASAPTAPATISADPPAAEN